VLILIPEEFILTEVEEELILRLGLNEALALTFAFTPTLLASDDTEAEYFSSDSAANAKFVRTSNIKISLRRFLTLNI
jgi:hypothetical protein